MDLLRASLTADSAEDGDGRGRKVTPSTVRSQNDVGADSAGRAEVGHELGFSLVDQTKMITAASELARNTLDYGGGGTVRLEALEKGRRGGCRLTFEDQGPGIPDVELALPTVTRPERAWAWAWAAPGGWSTNSRSPRGSARGPG